MKLNKNLIVRFLSIGLIAAALILSSCAQPSSGSAVNCGKEFNIEADKTVTVSFYNAKNGIKADNAITIASGTLNFYGNSTALKTDKRTDEEIAAGKAPRTITLSGCTITTDGVKTLYETNTYTKGAGVTIN